MPTQIYSTELISSASSFYPQQPQRFVDCVGILHRPQHNLLIFPSNHRLLPDAAEEVSFYISNDTKS